MTIEVFIDIFRDGISVFLTVITPILLVSLAVGLIISIFQTITSINEQTLTFAPKIIITFLVVGLLFGWIAQKIMDFTFRILTTYFGMI
ncbi:flagellar biosynthesis protein FliQ [Marinitoga sp. 1135]|uniref:Flagellar biosynthetic protein FliQ n=1 Tax=Marinitoga piezophila (strain DSM 14283 / JCM 11233 / KA3) TaxID=443254 RepID=H2J6G9_MARPK|nr:flagellar biosynthesis protein FliQ [Marinitoga piezophila]AEX85154.1 flagellar biosynthetic protein FliQ [Marinitoga piezophila KA3]APT75653.1 flagellar biosynthesis protein FliQ [Marinitoga sp. 1137]NUU95393.1 flagellar biosynthesis protein FliQ [Marinitoga sp. 1135]NUU97321.1 flagellar biosynthesis protein FliQ [Marinitoga sp. 1138]